MLFRILSIITLIVSIILLVLFILFVTGMSVISQFWGSGSTSNETFKFIVIAILILAIPVVITIISNMFFSNIKLLYNILNSLAAALTIIFIVVGVIAVSDIKKSVPSYDSNYEIKKPDNSNDQSEN